MVKDGFLYRIISFFTILIVLFPFISTIILYKQVTPEDFLTPEKDNVYLSPSADSLLHAAARISQKCINLILLVAAHSYLPVIGERLKAFKNYNRIIASWLFKKEFLYSPRELLP